MPRIFGMLIKEDIFGRKIPKKKLRQEVLEENRRVGKEAEERFEYESRILGHKLKRTGKGHDYERKIRNPFTGETTTDYVEIKSGKSKLSKLQKKTKTKNKNYTTRRYRDPRNPFDF